MSANKLYYETEERFIEENYRVFRNFINEFYLNIGLNFDGILSHMADMNDPVSVFNGLKCLILFNFPQYKDEFYKMLEEKGYDMKFEIMDAIRALASLKNVSSVHPYIFEAKQSPYIDDVEVLSNGITIKSERFGDFSFNGTQNYFKDNSEVMRLFTSGDLTHKCHQFSLELASELPQDKIITSLLPIYFKGTYYHSYLIDPEDNIIDGVNHTVMKKDEFDELFRPEEIIRYSYEEMYQEYIKGLSDGTISESDKFHIPVAVSLSKKLGGK